MTRLLIGITGSMGVFLMPSYLIELRQHFTNIKIIITHSASQFIPKESLEVFCDGIYQSEFPLSKENMTHIELARWAQIFCILPASAHVLAQASHGLADTLLSTTILAYGKRIIFFPNMNSAMWESPALQRNVATLEKEGCRIINPLVRPAFEYASRQIEMNHVMPSIESILSILKTEEEMLIETK